MYICYIVKGPGGDMLVYDRSVPGSTLAEAQHGCFRGLYDNAAGWIPRHYNMNSVRLGHVRLTIVYARVYVCVCVCCTSRVCVWSTSDSFPPLCRSFPFFTTFPLSRASLGPCSLLLLFSFFRLILLHVK